MSDPDAVILSIPLERAMHATLLQLAQEMGRSAEDLVREAVAAAIIPPSKLDLEALGAALLEDLRTRHKAPKNPIHFSDEDVGRIERFTLPEDRARLLLGDELITLLTGLSAQVPATADASLRLEAVAIICDLLRGSLSKDGVRRWWIKPRYKLGGKAPVEYLGWTWRPEELAFRMVVDLAESDAGFVAT